MGFIENLEAKTGTPEEAVEYALTWMVPNTGERQRLMDKYVNK